MERTISEHTKPLENTGERMIPELTDRDVCRDVIFVGALGNSQMRSDV